MDLVHQHAGFSVYSKTLQKNQSKELLFVLYARFVKKCCMQQPEQRLRKNLEVAILRMKYLEQYRYVFIFKVRTLTLNTEYSSWCYWYECGLLMVFLD